MEEQLCTSQQMAMNVIHKEVQLLVEKGADIFALDKDGKTALHCAAGTPKGYIAIQTLIEWSADVSVLDKDGKTALHYAAGLPGGDEEVRLLVEGGDRYFSP